MTEYGDRIRMAAMEWIRRHGDKNKNGGGDRIRMAVATMTMVMNTE